MGIINKLNGKEYTTQAALNRTLRKLGYKIQEYYDEFYKQEGEGICLKCSKPTKFVKFKYRKFCDSKCAAQYHKNCESIWKNKSEDELNMLKLKLSESAKLAHPKGGDWLKKRNQTILDKFGITELELHKLHFIERMSKLSPEEFTDFYDKATAASRKAGKKFKPYELNGEIINIQGYENLVLDALKKYISENKIKAGRGVGFYRYTSVNGNQRRYFPDIKIDNIIIEVKSYFTLNRDPDLINKLQCIVDAGLIPILAVWDPKQMEMCEKDLIETISSQALKQCEGRFNDYPFIGVGCKQMIAEVLGSHNNGI